MKKTVTACSLKKQAGNPSFNQNKRIVLFLCLMFFNFYSQTGLAQTTPTTVQNVFLNWNINVGCQIILPEKDRLPIDAIESTPKIRVCENTGVTYSLNGDIYPNSNVQWSITGGTASNITTTSNSSSIYVIWGNAGLNGANVTFTMNGISGNTITKTLQIEIIKKPIASFKVVPLENDGYTRPIIYTCIGQPIQFWDTSSTNGGSTLDSHYWDFGDGTFSSENNPSHTYYTPTHFIVNLVVTNSCGCKSTTKREVVVKKAENSLSIACPSVVCDGQTSTYNVPFGELQICKEFNFTSDGGSIIDNPNNGNVTVTWDHVDATGFGYLTIDPSLCDISCMIPSTIKVPVILSHGTITGKTVMCVGNQETFKLPQWPTTDFKWEIEGDPNNTTAILLTTDQRNEIVLQPLQSGTINLICNYTNTFLHCGGYAKITIRVSIPEPITGPTTLCVNSSGSYHTNSTNAVNWKLYKNNIIISALSNTNYFDFNYTLAGNYILEVSGSNVCDNQTTSITVNPIPVAPLLTNITAPLVICPNTPYDFKVTIPNPNMDYQWAIIGGTFEGASLGNLVTVKFNANGPYSLILKQTITGQSNCSSPFSTDILVGKQLEIFQIKAKISDNYSSLTPVISSCPNGLSTYYAVNDITAGLYTIGETYTWSVPASLGSIVSGQGTNTVSVFWNNVNSPTDANLSVTINKCTVTKTIPMVIKLKTVPVLLISTNTVCSGIDAVITLSTTNNMPLNMNNVINWEFGDGTTQLQTVNQSNTINGVTTMTHTYFTNAIGGNVLFNIKATINFVNGCLGNASALANITVQPGPFASASILSGGNSFCLPAPITTIMQAATADGATIEWRKGTSTANMGSSNQLIIGQFAPDSYYFMATNSITGCVTKSNEIAVYQQVCTVQPPPSGGVGTPCTPPSISLSQLASISTCDLLALEATTSLPPIFSYWTIFGPNNNQLALQLPGTDLFHYNLEITDAGIYHVSYIGKFFCNGVLASVQSPNVDFTVPYIASFNTKVTCFASPETYNIELISTSSFITTVTNRHFYYYWSTNVNGPWTAINNNPSLPNANFQTPSGTYYFKLVIDGVQDGATTASALCEKTSFEIDIAPNPIQNILSSNKNCFDSAVGLSVQPFISNENYVWTLNSNPLVTTLAPLPTHVFDSPFPNQAQTAGVSVLITNQYGCSRLVSTNNISIPERCFFGDITATTTTICKKGSIILNYLADGAHPNSCVPYYQWFDGNILLATTTVPTYTVQNVEGTHFYRLKLVSNINNPQTSCDFDCPSRITPTYKSLPTAVISAPTLICSGNTTNATATTDATNFDWLVDNQLQPFHNSTTIPLNSFAVGVHSLTLNTIGSGTPVCSNTATQNFQISETPGAPSVSYNLDPEDCNSYKITLTATVPDGGTGAINWSSGTPGNPTTVYSGGPYMATYNDGSGCLTSAQLEVPYSLDKYLWIFPTGCYSECDNNLGTIIGPNVEVPHWNWLLNNETVLEGSSFVDSYTPSVSGTYNLSLTSACNQISPAMDLNIYSCEECKVKYIVDKISCTSREFLKYSIALVAVNESGMILNCTVTATNNNALVVPAGFISPTGENIFYFDIIPLNGFVSGPIEFYINGVDDHGTLCNKKVVIEFPDCQFDPNHDVIIDPHQTGKEDAVLKNNSTFNLYPNPASASVNIQYDCQSDNTTLEVFDLTGKLLISKKIEFKKGELTLDTSAISSGLYLVVLKENKQVIMQKKLIIN